MKSKKILTITIIVAAVIIAATGGLIMLHVNFNKNPEADNNICPQDTKTVVFDDDFEPVFDNDTPFCYNKDSRLTIASFADLRTMADLNHAYPMMAVRKNEKGRPYSDDTYTEQNKKNYYNVYYTVYSLKDDKLAYVEFLNDDYTGRRFDGYLVRDITEYPYTSPEQEQKMSFLLPQDQPEKILKRAGITVSD